MARNDGLPFEGDLDELAERVQGREIDFDKTSFLEPQGADPASRLLEESGERILSGSLERHHVIASQFFKDGTLLGDLAATEIDGKALYDHRNFLTNGLRLPTTETDAAKLGASMHFGQQDNHGLYNEFLERRLQEIDLARTNAVNQFISEGNSPEIAANKALIEAAKEVRGLQEWLRDKMQARPGAVGPEIELNRLDPFVDDNGIYNTTMDTIRESDAPKEAKLARKLRRRRCSVVGSTEVLTAPQPSLAGLVEERA